MEHSKLASKASCDKKRHKMPELTNLTDRLAHLRERKGGSPAITGQEREEPVSPPTAQASQRKHSTPTGRRFANDYFMFFVYALLGIAVLTQLLIIVSLDIT